MKALYFDRDVGRILAVQTIGRVRKDAAFGKLSPVRYEEVPEPPLPGEGWVRVGNVECGLCGTDLHLMSFHVDPKSFVAALPQPARTFLGHEVWGRVIEVFGEDGRDERLQAADSSGDEAGGERGQPAAGFGGNGSGRDGRVDDSGRLCIGDRVALRIAYPSCVQMGIDPKCRHCREGNYMLCENVARRAPGTGSEWIESTGGGFSPRMIAHKGQLFRIPDEVPDERAVLLEPTAAAVHAVLRRRPHAGERVLVLGGGTIGLLLMACLRWYVPEIELHAVVRYDFQAACAEYLGAMPHRAGDSIYEDLALAAEAKYARSAFHNEIILGGFGKVFDAVGNSASLQDSLRWTSARGAVILVGADMRAVRVDLTPLWHQEIDLVGVDSHGMEEDGRSSFAHAARLLADPAFPVDDIVTHRFHMDDWREAVDTFRNKQASRAVKIVLTHPSRS